MSRETLKKIGTAWSHFVIHRENPMDIVERLKRMNDFNSAIDNMLEGKTWGQQLRPNSDIDRIEYGSFPWHFVRILLHDSENNSYFYNFGTSLEGVVYSAEAVGRYQKEDSEGKHATYATKKQINTVIKLIRKG